MFKKKETLSLSSIIEKYKTDPVKGIEYIDQLRESKKYKYDDKRLSDLKTLIEMAIIVGQKQIDNK